MNRFAFLVFALIVMPTFSTQAMEKPAFHTQGTPTGKPTGPLKPGEYWWSPHLSPSGPVIILVSLPQQIMNVYRNGILIARSTISSGSKNHPTPAGVFTILEKNRSHYSKTYDNAPMPNMQRLTWCGVAFHSGHLPGYAASHGCIRLPYDFSNFLFSITQKGGTVVVADGKLPVPYYATDPGLMLSSKDVALVPKALGKNDYEWNPEASMKGPITILISGPDHTLFVYRNGIRIGRAAVRFNGFGKLGEGVFTLLDGTSGEASPWAPNRAGHRWMAMTTNNSGRRINIEALHKRVRFNPDFAVKLHDALAPGTVLIITDQAAERKGNGEMTFGR
jgi:hypothetical protein